MFQVVHADCLDAMAQMREACVDSIVSDPPYGLSFMGKQWDHGVPGGPFWEAALRIAKPGAYLVSFGGTRTYHRLACAIEDAGWELRDSLMWLYGSGFPKSHNVSKAIDSAAGAEREVVGAQSLPKFSKGRGHTGKNPDGTPVYRGVNGGHEGSVDLPITKPATDAARQWEGWGTALKPAYEPIVFARAPFKGTVVKNVLARGTGALNIDGCRVVGGKPIRGNHEGSEGIFGMGSGFASPGESQEGRWPANVILDPEAAAILDAQTGKISARNGGNTGGDHARNAMEGGSRGGHLTQTYRDTGGASRFFYQAKASKGEREAGLEHLTPATVDDGRETPADNAYQRGKTKRRNTHPTVKPIELMRWLCRLVTPPGGVVVDPFCGSGTTGCAAVQEGFDFLGIEKEAEYVRLATARIEHWAGKC